MSIQFAGSKSHDDRRRRRLVVNFDDLGADDAVGDEDPSVIGLTSELVESEAAAPWVPVYEWRIWTYAALIGLMVTAAAFALSMPTAFRPELAPVTKHLLQGSRPVLAVLIQTTFWFLSAQLALLIGWYRSRCKIDFRGRYRVWTWIAAGLGIATICSASDAHGLLGQIVAHSKLLEWRPEVLSWVLPAILAGFPLMRLLDRDVRRSRSSLFTLRLAGLMGLTSACLELFASDFSALPWIAPTRTILPMVGTATLFVGLWLNARIVAYVCPDPPTADEIRIPRRMTAVWAWVVSLIVRPPTTDLPGLEFEAEIKPKRGRKKATTDEEESPTPRRKRRTPAKRTTKPRTRVKLADPEEAGEEPLEDQEESAYAEDSGDPANGYESAAEEADAESNKWTEEPEPVREQLKPISRSMAESTTPSNSAAKQPVAPAAEEATAASEDEDDEAGDTILRRDSGMTPDQFKGLSKRQKRELRRQSREQQRNQRH